MEGQNEITLQEIFSILWGKVLLIILCAIIGGGAAFGVTKFMIKPEYTSKVTMYVNNSDTKQDAYMNINDINASQKLVSTYVEILKSDTVLAKVLQSSGLDYSITEIRNMMSASSVNGTEIFEVKVVSKDPEHAALIANTIAEVGPEQIIRVVKAGSVELIDPAKVPQKPSSPNVILNTIIGIMLGGVLSVLGVLVYAMLDTRIKTEEDLEKSYGLPILGAIPCIVEDMKVNK